MQTPEFSLPVSIGDRVTFDTDEGSQAGTVNDLRRDVSNGELHAWVEVEHQWAAVFLAVPLSAIEVVKKGSAVHMSCPRDLSCDRCGTFIAEPSNLYEMPADFSCDACLTAAEVNNENVS